MAVLTSPSVGARRAAVVGGGVGPVSFLGSVLLEVHLVAAAEVSRHLFFGQRRAASPSC